MRSRVLKTTVLAAVAGAVWTQVPQVALHLRRPSLKCWSSAMTIGYAALLIGCISSVLNAGVKHRDGQPARVGQQTASAMSSRTRQ